jgi:hypothetical protein
MTLTQRQLDDMQCANPDCAHEHDPTLYLTQRCHPGAGTQVSYSRENGTLRVECAVCRKRIALVLVAATAAAVP